GAEHREQLYSFDWQRIGRAECSGQPVAGIAREPVRYGDRDGPQRVEQWQLQHCGAGRGRCRADWRQRERKRLRSTAIHLRAACARLASRLPIPFITEKGFTLWSLSFMRGFAFE